MVSKKRYILIIFILFITAYIAHNLIFLGFDKRICCTEILNTSIRFYHSIKDAPGSFLSHWKRLFGQGRALYSFFAVPFYYLFGISRDVAAYQNFLFLILLIFSVFKIGKLIGDRNTGYLSVFFLLMYPGTFGFLRIHNISFSIMAFTSFGVFCLLSSDNFRDIKKVLLLCVSCVALVKLKIDGIIFLIPPIIYYLYRSLKEIPIDSKKVFYRNLFIFVGFFLLLALFSIDFGQYMQRLGFYSDAIYNKPQKISENGVAIYARTLTAAQIGPINFLFFLFGGAIFIINRLRYKWIPLFWFIFPCIFYPLYFYISGIFAGYYIIGSLPAFALVSGSGIACFLNRRRRPARHFGYALVILLPLMYYMYASHFYYRYPIVYKKLRLDDEMTVGRACLLSKSLDEEMVDEIQREIDKLVRIEGFANVVFINHYPLLHLTYREISLKNKILRNNVDVYDFSDKVFQAITPDSEEYLEKKMKDANFIIDGNSNYQLLETAHFSYYYIYGAMYDFKEYVEREKNIFEKVKANFTPIKRIKIEDGKEVALYVKNR